jgi:hypothetical protein
MAKIDASQILRKEAKLKVEKIDFSNKEVKQFIEQSKKQQKEVLRYGVVNPEKLKLVVQLS